MNHVLGKGIPGRGHSMCEGPEEGLCLVCWGGDQCGWRLVNKAVGKRCEGSQGSGHTGLEGTRQRLASGAKRLL